MLYPLASGGYVYRPLKQGLAGWDVLALQEDLVGVGLALAVDGEFGPQTFSAVRSFQGRFRDFVVDGIAGTATQKALLLELLWPHQRQFDTPAGLGRGLIEGECAFQLGNYTKPYADGTRDVGPVMEHIAVSDSSLQRSFDGRAAIGRMVEGLRESKDAAFTEGQKHPTSRTRTHEGAWKYGAVLRHNWQAASFHYVQGDVATWEYEARFDKWADARSDRGSFVRKIDDRWEVRRYLMSTVAQWVAEIGVAGVNTGLQWAEHYVATKTLYVTAWPA